MMGFLHCAGEGAKNFAILKRKFLCRLEFVSVVFMRVGVAQILYNFACSFSETFFMSFPTFTEIKYLLTFLFIKIYENVKFCRSKHERAFSPELV